MTSYSSNGDGMRILSKNWSLPRDWRHRPTAVESGERLPLSCFQWTWRFHTPPGRRCGSATGRRTTIPRGVPDRGWTGHTRRGPRHRRAKKGGGGGGGAHRAWARIESWHREKQKRPHGVLPPVSGLPFSTESEQRYPSWRIGRSIDPNPKPRDVPTEGPPQQGPADAGPPDGPGRQPGRAPSGRPRLSPSSHTDPGIAAAIPGVPRFPRD